MDNRLQRVDTLLRNESVDYLRQILISSELKLLAKRNAVVAVIGDAHPQVLRCATAISNIYSNCKAILDSTATLKDQHSELQSLLLDAGPVHRRLWKRTEDDVEGSGVSEWLNICPSLWNVLLVKSDPVVESSDVNEIHKDRSESERLRKVRKIQRSLVRSYGDLPRAILDLLNESKPLESLCLLCGWGPHLRQRLLEISADPSTTKEDKINISSVVGRQRSYFSCHDLLNRIRMCAIQLLSSPEIPNSIFSNSNILPSSSTTVPTTVPLSLHCHCGSCRALLQSFSCPGTFGMLKLLSVVVLTDPISDQAIQRLVVNSRTQLIQKLIKFSPDESTPDLGECQLSRLCFNHPDHSTADNTNNYRLIQIGYQLSSLIRAIEVTNDILLILENNQFGTVRQLGVELLSSFCKSEELPNCDCRICSLNKRPNVHIWGDCSHLPVVSSTPVLSTSDDSLNPNVESSSAQQFSDQWRGVLVNVITEVLDNLKSEHSLNMIDGMWRLVSLWGAGVAMRKKSLFIVFLYFRFTV